MIRQLTTEDWPAMEAILDTRKTLQGVGMTDELHAALKASVQSRLVKDGHFFYGYFVEDSLQAMCTYFVIGRKMFLGATWTMAGNTLPKREGTRWASALIEIRDFAMTEHNPDMVYRMTPVSENWGAPDVDDNILFNDYRKQLYLRVPAFTQPEDRLVWELLMISIPLPLDQEVFIYTHKLRMPPLPNCVE